MLCRSRRPITFLILAAAVLVSAWGLHACTRSSGSRGTPPGPPEALVTFPAGGAHTGVIPVEYRLIDAESDLISIEVAYSTDGGQSYFPATEDPSPTSEGTQGLSSGLSPGVPHLFQWDTRTDLGALQLPDVRIKISPADSAPGQEGISLPFSLDNRIFLPPEVVDVSDSFQNTSSNDVEIQFSKPIVPASVVHLGTGADTIAVFRDQDTVFGGPFDQEGGAVVLEDGDRRIRYLPPVPFDVGLEIRIVLSGGIVDGDGQPLVPGTTVPSAPLSFTPSFPDQVFEIRFVPGVGPVTARFRPDPNSDIWFLDFDSFGTFDGDLGNRGLRGFDPLVAQYARDLVIGQVLSVTGLKYFRDPYDGAPISGAYRISFVAITPPGVLRGDYSRMCNGLTVSWLWGAAWLDLGNAGKEDNCSSSASSPSGVFAGGIYGINSLLTPGLGPGDLSYVDGSYLLGSDPSRDARFLEVRGVIWDWGYALGLINAHEVGHSVGLVHDDSHSLNIMLSFSSLGWVSDPAVRFSAASQSRLNGNLGRVP